MNFYTVLIYTETLTPQGYATSASAAIKYRDIEADSEQDAIKQVRLSWPVKRRIYSTAVIPQEGKING